MADKAKKCANPACSCTLTDGDKFCSAHCESLGSTVEVTCKCGHPGCAGETRSNPMSTVPGAGY